MNNNILYIYYKQTYCIDCSETIYSYLYTLITYCIVKYCYPKVKYSERKKETKKRIYDME